jgi:ABC-type uncharacterized transport system substrate-binding protein
MAGRYCVRILSSYIYEHEDVPHRDMGRKNRWFHGFVRSLTRNGSSLNAFDIEFVRLPPPPARLSDIADRFDREGVQLLICAGTDAVVRWLSAGLKIPVLYFGAHPENHGLDVLTRGHITGVRLNLPLVWNFENFSLVRELLPEVRDVFIPLNLDSPFAFPDVRANYELFRRQHQSPWITGPSSHLGYRSVYFLAARLDCRYHEGPFATIAELDRCLDDIPAGPTSAVVGFNDLVLLEGALDRVLTIVRDRGLPLFWVNNANIVRAAGVADFSSDFEKVGERLGEMCLRIVRDNASVRAVPFATDQGERFSLNLRRCSELGLAPGEHTRQRFHAMLS